MIDREISEKFDRDGCVLVKNLISKEKAAEIRSLVVQLAEIEKKNGFIRIGAEIL